MAFYSVEIAEKDKEKTAFECLGRAYEFNGMVMGYKNAPMVLQRIMTRELDSWIGNGVEVYYDDILIHAKSKEQHDQILNGVLEILEANFFRINVNIIQFRKQEVKMLGVIINGNSITPVEEQKKR